MSNDLNIQPTFREIFETMNCGIVCRDAYGTITLVNPTLLSWLGYERHELLGKPLALLGPVEWVEALGAEIAATNDGDLRMRLGVLRRRDSTTFPALLIPQRLHDSEGAFVGAFSVVVDFGAVQTARSVELPGHEGVQSRWTRALELQDFSLVSELVDLRPASLEHPALRALSLREREVLGRLVVGERVPTIAAALYISPHTVRNHLKSIFRKLAVANQAELIQYVRSLATDCS